MKNVPLKNPLDPFPYYQMMREQNPVAYDPQSNTWNVFKMKHVKQLASDYERLSSEKQFTEQSPIASSLIMMDPPNHRQLRGLVSKAFTPKSIQKLEPRIREITKDLLDSCTPTQSMEFVQNLAYPLPVIVIAELLGVEPSKREEFKNWSTHIISVAGQVGGKGLSDIQIKNFMDAQKQMTQYFLTIFEERRSFPKDDLISILLDAEVDGKSLTEEELLGFCMLLLIAGHETTINLLSNFVRCLIEKPEIQNRLRTNPEEIPKAVEEVLRLYSPVQAVIRTAKTDIAIEDVIIPKDSRVLLWLGSANHDPEVFERPDTFLLERVNIKHTAFGHGIHYCLGAPLAKLEAVIAVEELLKRFSMMELEEGKILEPLSDPVMFGLKELWLTVK
ncbi:cytochrome P450 [Metabacillus sp. JX24]|uniref:cytochrome P450 n=1 Tax=Metabacillus sp. JX24 TaxID=3240759 RepID=UPI00350F9F04